MERRNIPSVSEAKRAAQQGGQQVESSRSFELLITVGLLAYGVVHLLVAWIAVQLAWTGRSPDASQKGAFQQMAATPVGGVLLWITAVGLFALTLWQVFEALWGHRDRDEGRKRVLSRLGSAGKAVLYAALGVSAVSTAAGSASSGDSTQKTVTAQLMSTPRAAYSSSSQVSRWSPRVAGWSTEVSRRNSPATSTARCAAR